MYVGDPVMDDGQESDLFDQPLNVTEPGVLTVTHPFEGYHLDGDQPGATLAEPIKCHIPVKIASRSGRIRHDPDFVPRIQQAECGLHHADVSLAAANDYMLATFRKLVNESVRTGVKMGF